ncbi:NADP-dependent oxidoreductase domain-containing protein [Cantharellus anzutake]|uniref:NADP-dependent oxidoreductase domain-containing protein n=1 Tax=Cantharellus anzutake TaxID=1750568 RepID=UPI00190554F7|nr:NADP-dependent oxidoreductase domain-containing protein [Cantharellus anzutake]KAF8325076.1 NADP-dependent oxidoreductase domain-containing protein [Cantharellus anzutake]
MLQPPLETVNLGPLTVPRIWIGLWQLSSPAWGTAPVSRVKSEMNQHYLHGFTTFADHYGSAELIFGQFRRALLSADNNIFGEDEITFRRSRRLPLHPPLCATKWCIFMESHIPYTRSRVEDAVRERMRRTMGDTIDILQVHWQHYDNSDYVNVFRYLVDIKRDGELKVRALGLVNFDSQHVNEICETIGPGELLTNQVQFSLIDVRPLYDMAAVCKKHGVKLLTYGTLCGGFLSDPWLGKPQPDPYKDKITPSQRKYLDVITDGWGTWDLFQALLTSLRTIADRHGGLSIANVATRWVLDHPFVGAVIVGARLGVAQHREDNARTIMTSFHLTAEDNQIISNVLARSNGPRLIHTMGDCGAEYR